jgi:glycosyltransferase involved in cell wall biosynthesis
MPVEMPSDHRDDESQARRPRICIISATPLTLHFFFRDHVAAMCRWADVTLLFNHKLDKVIQPLELSTVDVDIPIKRKIDLLSDLKGLYCIYKILRRGKFDLVITLVPKAGLLGSVGGWFAKVPVRLHIFQGEVWASKRGIMRAILKFCDAITSSLSTDLLAVSHSERNFLANQGVVSEDKIWVLQNGSIGGVDTRKFQRCKKARHRLRKKFDITDEDILLLFLGRVVKDKGVLELLEAFTTLAPTNPYFKLAFVGPDEEGLLSGLLAELDSDVTTHIIVEGFTREPHQWLSASDILVIPSYREGFGVAAIEAAAAGLPVIGTRVHGLTDAVEDGVTGVLVPLSDEYALARAICDLAVDKERRKTLGAAGRRRVRRDFEAANVVGAYDAFFEALARNQHVGKSGSSV